MKVLIACSVTPFTDSPVQQRARILCRRLVDAGHEAEILRIPFAAEPAPQLPSQLVMMRSFETWNVDHLVALDLPASLLPHPRKSLWLEASLPLGANAGAALRTVVRNALREAIASSRAAFSASAGARDLLRDALELDVPLLHVPPRALAGAPGKHILAAAPREADDVRLLAALALAAPDIHLVVAGEPAAPGQAQALRAAAHTLGVAARVQVDLRELPAHDIDAYLAASVAVACFGSVDDIGFALAAAAAGKAPIAHAGNADVAALVRPQLSGWLVSDSSELAAAFDDAWIRRHRAIAYGAQARALLSVCGVDWPRTLDTLLA